MNACTATRAALLGLAILAAPLGAETRPPGPSRSLLSSRRRDNSEISQEWARRALRSTRKERRAR